jgi:IPT/TIG domain/Glucose / Sorbosone dehydrogenase
VVSYKWTNVGTREVLSTEATFSYDFPVGVTTLRLEIQDSTCDVAAADTTVTVTGSISPGAYCYYYNSVALPTGVGLESDVAVKPTFAFEHVKWFQNSIPLPPATFTSKIFAARCFVLFEALAGSEATTLSVTTAGTGDARLYKGSELVVPKSNASAATPIPAGITMFEVQYLRTTAQGVPQLTVLVNGTALPLNKMNYDRSQVLPVLSGINPLGSVAAGGGTATINGYGFYKAPYLSFGSASPVQANGQGLTPTEMTVKIPSSTKNGTVALTASTSIGGLASNAIDFEYGGAVPEAVAFTQKVVTQNGAVFSSSLTTSVAVWGDSWYLGRIGGTILKLTVNADLLVTGSCVSTKLSDPAYSKNGIPSQVDILGIAFDPRDTVGKPYVSSQTLFWFIRNTVDNTNYDAWHNGRIERFAPGGACLVLEERIVSGLPVSDHDHGVNGITFDNDGNFYVGIGGGTNGGLPGARFGYMFETPLSAGILTFNPSAPNFDGAVTYDQNYLKHPIAKQLSGDVSVYATGLRNPFGVAFTSKAELYATDNGPNTFSATELDGFGRFSTNCVDIMPTSGAPAKNYPDKIVKVTGGAFFGHPNLNRGQCQFIDPFTGKDLNSPPQNPPPSYKPPLFTVQSSVDGIMEYTASHFAAQLKGELIVTTFTNQGTRPMYRVRTSPPRLLTLDNSWSALSVAQGVWGEIVLPKSAGNLQVLQPDYVFPSTISARAVSPFRGGAGGGLLVTITGHNFGTNPTVTFKGAPCVVSGAVQTTSRGDLLKCTTPASSRGVNLVDVVVTSGGASSTITNGFMYMNV